MLKLILSIVYAVLSIGGGAYLLWKYQSLAGATAMFYILIFAVLIFVIVGLVLIMAYVPSSESSSEDTGVVLGA